MDGGYWNISVHNIKIFNERYGKTQVDGAAVLYFFLLVFM